MSACSETLGRVLSALPLKSFKGLFSAYSRISVVLDSKLRRDIWRLFFWMIVSSVFELASVFSLALFFRLIYSPAFIFQLPGVSLLIDNYPFLQPLLNDPKNVMLWGCLFPILLILLKNIFAAAVSWKSAILSEKVSAYIGNGIMEKYLHMPYSWHLSSRQAQAALALRRRFSLGVMLLHILSAYSNIITIIVLFCGLFFYNPAVSGCAVFSMFIISLATYVLLKNRIDKAGKKTAQEDEKENAAAQTAFAATRDIIIYQKQDVFLRQIKEAGNKAERPRAFISLSSTIPTWTLESGGFFLIWLTIYFMNNYTNATHAEVSGTIALLALTAWRVLPALNRVVGAIVTVRANKFEAFGCLDYLDSLNAIHPELPAKPDPGFKLEKEIKFDNVSYTYPDSAAPSLKNITCRIPLGAAIGLVGRSGAGKTTFINILGGLLSPDSGNLLADDQPMTPARLAAYRKQIGCVPQNPYILEGTVSQNVGFKDWGETVDEKRARTACMEAAIDFLGSSCENISRKAEGALSGGQLQRVSIARALYADPALLIFDEATSALDQSAEAIIQEAILKNRGKRTYVIAAHRLETLEICDTIFWLENGELIRVGPAHEIISAYREALREAFPGKSQPE